MGTIIGIIVGVAVFVGISIFTFLDLLLSFLIENIQDKRREKRLKNGKYKPTYEVGEIDIGGTSNDSLEAQISRGVADGMAHYDVAHGNSQGNSSYGGW